eukprot:6181725-Pleurochrysis_carterae.AAC.1
MVSRAMIPTPSVQAAKAPCIKDPLLQLQKTSAAAEDGGSPRLIYLPDDCTALGGRDLGPAPDEVPRSAHHQAIKGDHRLLLKGLGEGHLVETCTLISQ